MDLSWDVPRGIPKSVDVEPSITRLNLELDVAAIRLEKCHDDSNIKL